MIHELKTEINLDSTSYFIDFADALISRIENSVYQRTKLKELLRS